MILMEFSLFVIKNKKTANKVLIQTSAEISLYLPLKYDIMILTIGFWQKLYFFVKNTVAVQSEILPLNHYKTLSFWGEYHAFQTLYRYP